MLYKTLFAILALLITGCSEQLAIQSPEVVRSVPDMGPTPDLLESPDMAGCKVWVKPCEMFVFDPEWGQEVLTAGTETLTQCVDPFTAKPAGWDTKGCVLLP